MEVGSGFIAFYGPFAGLGIVVELVGVFFEADLGFAGFLLLVAACDVHGVLGGNEIAVVGGRLEWSLMGFVEVGQDLLFVIVLRLVVAVLGAGLILGEHCLGELIGVLEEITVPLGKGLNALAIIPSVPLPLQEALLRLRDFLL